MVVNLTDELLVQYFGHEDYIRRDTIDQIQLLETRPALCLCKGYLNIFELSIVFQSHKEIYINQHLFTFI